MSERVYARAYCRNLKLRVGEPFGLIRLEAEQRYDPKTCPLQATYAPDFLASLWRSRYGGLAPRVVRLGREVQATELAERMREGELRYGEAERLHLFLELERLGIASCCYPKSVHSARRRAALKLGYSVNDSGREAIDVELPVLIGPYLRTVTDGLAA